MSQHSGVIIFTWKAVKRGAGKFPLCLPLFHYARGDQKHGTADHGQDLSSHYKHYGNPVNMPHTHSMGIFIPPSNIWLQFGIYC